MPEPVNPGVKSPAGTPPAGTGAGGTNPPTAGSPPVDDLEFQDDQIVEQDGKKMVPLEVVLGEREKWKRRVSSTPPATTPAEPEPGPEPEPLFNWEKLVPQQQGAGQQSQPAGAQGQPMQPAMDPSQFEDQFRDMLNDKPWQAIMWAMQTGMQYRDRMESQARQFVPDYGNLAVHEVSDQEVQMLASNPYAMKAMIAKAKSGVGSRTAPRGTTPQASNPPPASAPPAQSSVSPEAIKAAMELITSLGRTSGVSGEGTGGPATPPSGETVELDKEAVAYFRACGYTDEQIKQQAQKIVDIRRRRGQM